MLWNKKLENFDMLIDLAEIKTLSQKMYNTGKISKKIIKKWRVRSEKVLRFCKKPYKCNMVLRPRTDIKYFKLNWICTKCRCSTQWLFEDEVSEPLRNAYKGTDKLKNREEYEKLY